MTTRARALSIAAIALIVVAACARHDSPKAVASRGATLFVKNCAACHGERGAGPIGPSLVQIRTRKSSSEIEAVIRNPDPPMPKLYPQDLTDADIADLTAFVETL